MTAATESATGAAGTAAAVLPPGPRLPRALQGAAAIANRRGALRALQRRYGTAFTISMPTFGRVVVLSEPSEVKALFTMSPDLADNTDVNLGRVLGDNSMFALTDARHRKHRKMLVPPFHGRRLAAYESAMVQATRAETATWDEGREFASLPAMMRVTIDIILRTVFGAEGDELEELRRLLPRWVELGSKLAVVPIPDVRLGGHAPWEVFRRDRARYDRIVDSLIERARRDPALDERDDVLALLLQARYDDGSALTRDEIADQLVTLLTAGHETTATSLAWILERLRRHPDVLARLVAEVDGDGTELLAAVITETQRTRPVIDVTFRQVRAESLQLGRWTFPRGTMLMPAIGLIHSDPSLFADPERFDPGRFVGTRPDTFAWIPFGGGVRRCIGAAFADMEMRVVLRTLLREFELVPTDAPDEKFHSRGIAYAPKRGGRITVRRR